MSDFIQSRRAGRVLYLYLNRPEVFNSFNREMALALQDELQLAADDAEVRAVVLTGMGKAFCAGQDLKEVTIPELNPGFKKILEEHYNPIIKQIRALKKPVIAAVNGVAAGAGANIALACDLVVATEQASFIQAFSKIGLVPDSGGTFFLPRLIGMQRATALMFLGDKVSAEEAERIGMIYKAVSPDEYEQTVDMLAERLAGLPTAALARTKMLLNSSLNSSLEGQLQLESEQQIAAAQSIDYAEGVAAFIDKRKPNFIGR